MPRAPIAAVLLVVLAVACTDQTASAPARQVGGRTRPSAAAPAEPQLAPSEPFGQAEVTLRGPDGRAVEMPVYVAADGATRQRGLMDRDEFPAEAGMLFLYPDLTTGAFWMYRTRIPLSIAFFGEAGDIVAMADMEPCRANNSAECPVYDPLVAYRGALEVNQGIYAAAGVGEGWTIDLPDELLQGSG